MRTRRFILLSLLLILGLGGLYAAEIDTLKARTAAENFYLDMLARSRWSLKKSVPREIRLTLVHTEEAQETKEARLEKETPVSPLYYIFNVNTADGFVIVSGDDRTKPILAYAYTGAYSIDEQAPALQDWMKNYRQQIEHVRNKEYQVTGQMRQAWDDLLSPASLKSTEAVDEVLPLLSTRWDQGCYYNELCPADERGVCGRVWAGCVAVGIAQIMKYWEYPQSGLRIPGYREPLNYENDGPVPGSAYGCIPDLPPTVFQWANMPDQLDQESSAAELAAVSELIYHVGVSNQMNYGPYGSGAAGDNTQNALISYFHYSPGLYFTSRSDYEDPEWTMLMKEELDQGRPVSYGGCDTGGCHAFVCDGYQDDDYFHFNWGWSGWGNGYFLLSALNPGTAEFNEYQSAIVGIEPGTVHADPYEDLIQIEGLGPDFIQTIQTEGSGSWDLRGCYRHTPGGEQLYAFTTVDSGNYGLHVPFAEGDLDYSYRKAVCGEPGWRCFSRVGTDNFNGIYRLSGQTNYHLLLDDPDTIPSTHQFYLSYLGLPELIFQGMEIDDDSIVSQGNNNGVAEPGETLELRVNLANTGTGDTYYVTGELTSSDTLIRITDAYENFGDIPAGGQAMCNSDFDLVIPPDYTTGTQIPLALEIHMIEGNWIIPIFLPVHPLPPDPCENVVLIEGAGSEHVHEFSGGGHGAWNPVFNGEGTPGLEQVYRFIPADTGVYRINLSNSYGAISLAWKEDRCGASAWHYMEPVDSSGSCCSPIWEAGSTFYLLFDDRDTLAGSHPFFLEYLGMPLLGYTSHIIDDPEIRGGANADGKAQPGERFYVNVTLENTGDCCARQVSARLSADHSEVQVFRDSIFFGDIEADSSAMALAGFDLRISGDCPCSVEIPLYLEIFTEGKTYDDQFMLDVGVTGTLTPEDAGGQSFQVYPNPCTDRIQISFPDPGDYLIEVKSVHGRVILSREVDGDMCRLDFSVLPAGVYFISVRSGAAIGTKAIVKL